MKSTLRHILAAAALILITLLTASCNTVEGAGRDIERGGEEIQDLAD